MNLVYYMDTTFLKQWSSVNGNGEGAKGAKGAKGA